MTRLVVIDDHPVVRAGLISAFDAEPDLRVIGDAGDGLAGWQVIQQMRPDVAVVDLAMPGLSGLDVARRVVQAQLVTRVLILSFHGANLAAHEAFAAGAWGYLAKDAALIRLLGAVRQIARGQRMSPPGGQVPLRPDDPWGRLTPREQEIATLLSEGYSHADVGQRLEISPRTVEVHRANLMRKLSFTHNTDLVRFVMARVSFRNAGLA